MQKFQIEGVEGKLPPEVEAAIAAVEKVLRLYRRTPFPLVGKHRDGLATQCALAALGAAGHDLLPDDG
jgi:hypothetical protein